MRSSSLSRLLWATSFLARRLAGAEAHGALADAPADDALQADKGAAADEQNIGGVDRRELLVRMLASALGRNIGDRSFQDLQQRLLHALAADIAGNRRILVLAPDLVDLVDIDDSGLRPGDVAIGGLQQLENDVLDILADVAGLGERGGVDNGEGHVKHLGQRLRQQGLAGSGGTDQQDVRFGELDIAVALAIHVDALVVVINGDRQLLLGLFLADHVFIEKGFHFLRLGQLTGSGRRLSFAAVVLENRIANGDTFVADVGPGIIAGRRNQFGDSILGLVAKRAAQNFIRTRPSHVTPSTLTNFLQQPARRAARRSSDSLPREFRAAVYLAEAPLIRPFPSGLSFTGLGLP